MFAGHPVSFRALSANLLQLWISSLDSKLPNHQQITSISKLEVLTESSSQLKVGTGNVFRPVEWTRFTTSVRTLSLNFECFWFSKRQKATKSLEQFWFARFSYFVCTVSLLVATARRLLGLPKLCSAVCQIEERHDESRSLQSSWTSKAHNHQKVTLNLSIRLIEFAPLRFSWFPVCSPMLRFWPIYRSSLITCEIVFSVCIPLTRKL